MLFQADMLQILADIIGAILTFLKPIVSPIGAWMVDWIEVALQYFPTDSLTLYIGIFIFLIVAGGIVNSIWHGDKPPGSSKTAMEEIPDDKIQEVEEEFKAINTEGEIERRDSTEFSDDIDD